MGQRAKDQDAYPNKEMPEHRVAVSRGFWIDRNEVTDQQWRKLMETSPWSGSAYVREDDRTPAVYISWHDA